MADFGPIFEKMIKMEGGFVLHEVEGDRGGMTYAGIARNFWESWPGWEKIDDKEFDAELTMMVRQFYYEHYWVPIQGDLIKCSAVTYHIFAFGVNTGRGVAARMAQQLIGALQDGVLGPKSIELLNELLEDEKSSEIFVLRYSLLKIFRYKNICSADKRRSKDVLKSNMKFLRGWINRVEGGLT